MLKSCVIALVSASCLIANAASVRAQGQTVESFLLVAPKQVATTTSEVTRPDWFRGLIGDVTRLRRGSVCLDPEIATAVRPLIGDAGSPFVLQRSGDVLNVRENRDVCSSFVLSEKAFKNLGHEHLKTSGKRQWQVAFGYPATGDTLTVISVRLKLHDVSFSHLDPAAARRTMTPDWQRSVHSLCLRFKARPGTQADATAKCACIVNAALDTLTADAARVFKAIYAKDDAWKLLRTRLTRSEDTRLNASLDRGKQCPDTGGTSTLAALTSSETGNTTEGSPTTAPVTDISGAYAEIGSGRRIAISVWGNGYYYIEADGQRMTAYFDASTNRLSVFDGDPTASPPIAVLQRAQDGTFSPSEGQGVAGFRPIDSVAPRNDTGSPASREGIVGPYSVNGRGRIEISDWGNSYYYVDWGGKRYTAYFDVNGGRLTLYDGEPNASSASWIYERQNDGSFKHNANDGSVSVLSRLQ